MEWAAATARVAVCEGDGPGAQPASGVGGRSHRRAERRGAAWAPAGEAQRRGALTTSTADEAARVPSCSWYFLRRFTSASASVTSAG